MDFAIPNPQINLAKIFFQVSIKGLVVKAHGRRGKGVTPLPSLNTIIFIALVLRTRTVALGVVGRSRLGGI